jgi:hypothetical protein
MVLEKNLAARPLSHPGLQSAHGYCRLACGWSTQIATLGGGQCGAFMEPGLLGDFNSAAWRHVWGHVHEDE